MRALPDGAHEALRSTDLSHHGGEVFQQAQSQLSGVADIKAAHAWVQPTGGEAHLPSLGLSAHTPGVESAAMHVAMPGHAAMMPGTGLESAAMHIMPGSEHGALTAAQQVGNQAISPIIQMIMKMPGHIGLISSFFECLAGFFAPLKEMIAGMDFSQLAAHAEGALHSATNMVTEHMHLDLSMLPSDAPALNMPDGSGLGDAVASATGGHGFDFNNLASSEPSLVSHDALNVSGYTDGAKISFENSALSQFPDPSGVGAEHQFLAMDSGSAIFRPTVGGGVQTVPIPNAVQSPIVQPNTVPDFGQSTHPALSAAHPAAPAHAPAAHHAAHARDVAPAETSDRGSLLGHPHARPAEITPEAPQTADSGAGAGHEATGAPDTADSTYTIKHGDNLWDIAREQLGDGTKWHDIYQLNHDVLGDHPAMIHAGTSLHLPGGHEVASNYTVHSGDTLWDISKDHLGGGQHWPELYHNNTDIIGSNPNLIHPGQHLSMSDHGGQLAQAGPHSQLAHHSAGHEVAHGSSSHHAPSHEAPAHAKVAHAPAHPVHPKIASADTQSASAGSQQVPQAMAQTPGGTPQSTIGLKTDQTMGQLETSAAPVQSYNTP